MYYLIRVILCFFILIPVFLIVMKAIKKKNKLIFIILFAIAFISLCSALSFCPIENQLINFQTPEDVFIYTSVGKINNVVYGEESCLISYKNQNETYQFVGKQSNGYSILTQASIKKVTSITSSKGVFDITHIKNTRDYYVSGFMLGNDITLYDKSGTKIPIVVYENDSGAIFFYINNLNRDHYLIIDDTRVDLL